MSGADLFAGFVAGVVVASVFWALFVAVMLARLEAELELASRLEAESIVLEDELDDWHGWGDVPPIPPHGGVG